MIIKNEQQFVGLDVGERRIGVARVHSIVKLAEPLDFIDVVNQDVNDAIVALVKTHSADGLVIGLPRGLDGQETDQTNYSREFAQLVKDRLNIPVYLIDEAGTSKSADDRNVDGKYSRDSVAAAIFLEDFVNLDDKEALRI